MKTFKRYQSALDAAGDRDIVQLRLGGETLFVVPDATYSEACDEVAILAHAPNKLSPRARIYAGQVTPRHLKRLGNANWAEPGAPGSKRLTPAA
jgi:hypothetical protein